MKTRVRSENIKKIINAEHSDPFSVLGLHKIKHDNNITFVIRAYYPNCKSVKVLTDNKEYSMEKTNSIGFFELLVHDKNDFFDYKLKIIDNKGYTFTTPDPYSFLPVISDFDSNLFTEGKHDKIYNYLGAHEIVLKNITGTHFALWAPNASRVSVVGDFNQWDGRRHQCRRISNSGIWEIFIPLVTNGDLYKYEIKTYTGELFLKSDPFSFYSEQFPQTASIVKSLSEYKWHDEDWILKRNTTDKSLNPISIYEIHLDSWKRERKTPYRSLKYNVLINELIPYIKNLGFNHIELIQFIEHSFSINSQLGTPKEFMNFIDQCHTNNIGVILNWNLLKPVQREGNLYKFDGTHLFENSNGVYNYSKKEVQNFLISNAIFWLEKYHIDGLDINIDSFILNSENANGDKWINNGTIEFIQNLTTNILKYYPNVLTISKGNINFDSVTKPSHLGGLGFTYKWNIGWKNTLYKYINTDPIYRKHLHNDMTLSLFNAFNENNILPLSHDDVIYGKCSLINKIHGDYWQKFATLRALFGYMYGHPGKKLTFMGNEIGQFNEWNYYESIDWNLLDFEMHEKLNLFFKDLNKIYKNNPALYKTDLIEKHFAWIDFNDSDKNTFSFTRKFKNTILIFISNFSPVVHESYRIGAEFKTFYEEILNSDSGIYGGSNVGNLGGIHAEEIPYHNKPYSINLRIPPLATLILKPILV